MHRYILTRLFYAFISLVLLSVTIFVMIRITGDPVVLMADPGAKEEDLQALRIELGLDRDVCRAVYRVCHQAGAGRFWQIIHVSHSGL